MLTMTFEHASRLAGWMREDGDEDGGEYAFGNPKGQHIIASN
jgi:hypothetical protein